MEIVYHLIRYSETITFKHRLKRYACKTQIVFFEILPIRLPSGHQKLYGLAKLDIQTFSGAPFFHGRCGSSAGRMTGWCWGRCTRWISWTLKHLWFWPLKGPSGSSVWFGEWSWWKNTVLSCKHWKHCLNKSKSIDLVSGFWFIHLSITIVHKLLKFRTAILDINL